MTRIKNWAKNLLCRFYGRLLLALPAAVSVAIAA
jgi:hypothetical protein